MQVSAILNPSLAQQTVIVESVHNGTVPIDSGGYDPANPVATGYGIPLSGATIVVADTLGASTGASETTAGVYRFAMPIVSGRRYTLSVTTPQGVVVTGSTTVPIAAPATINSAPDTFDVATGRLAFHWAPARLNSRYLVAVQSPLVEYTAIIQDTSVTLTGALIDPVGEGLSLVFVPGFTQTATVSAIDTNYYDWLRERISADASQRTQLHGGYGIFGSLIIVAGKALACVAPPAPSPEGTWTQSSPVAGLPAQLALYREAAHPADTAISGNYRFAGDSSARGFLGRLSNDSVHLDLLPAWSALDTLARADGVVSGSALTLILAGTSVRAVYQRQ